MNILSIEDIRKTDEYTIKNEPIDSIDLMEGCEQMLFLYKNIREFNSFVIFAGTGNNGGDGLVIARKLMKIAMMLKFLFVNLAKLFCRFSNKSK